MKVTIEIYTGPNHETIVSKRDMDKNIQALERAISNKKTVADDILLMDTITILEGIKEQLPYG